MRRFWITLAMCGLAIALAQSYVDISIGGQFILRLRTGAGKFTLEERARIVEERLSASLGARLTPEDITLKEVKRDHQYEIYIRGRLLLTVTPEDAQAAKMSVRQLAEHWTKALREKLPPLSARPPASQ
jgi:hypothetical protein